jgi:uroporphyrinogen-III synthase
MTDDRLDSATGTERPLAGLGVVVTRPAAQAETLVGLLESAGAHAIRIPLLAVDAPTDPDRALATLRDVGRFDLAVFVSANAASRGLALLATLGGVPAGLRLAAIGRATAEALRQQGHPPHCVPAGRFDSEALLELEDFQTRRLSGRRVLIVRGEGGRELLADALRSRGAEVAYAEVYRRVRPAVDVATLDARGRAGGVDAVIVTSGEAVEHLFDAVPPAGRAWLDRAVLVVPSERVGEVARRLGHPLAPLVAREAGDRALVEALVTWRLALGTPPRTPGEGASDSRVAAA